jgi:spermidine/putrescine transport system permease protein
MDARCLIFLYLPTICITLASLTASRYFQFPINKWGTDWWQKTFSSIEIRQLLSTSITIALCVTVIAVTIAFFGALAFARYEWKGRSIYQKLILLPIFFPQSVLGLALLLWFNTLGLPCRGRPRSSLIWSGSFQS